MSERIAAITTHVREREHGAITTHVRDRDDRCDYKTIGAITRDDRCDYKTRH